MMSIVRPGSKSEEKFVVSGVLLPASQMPSLMYPVLPKGLSTQLGGQPDLTQYSEMLSRMATTHSLKVQTFTFVKAII